MLHRTRRFFPSCGRDHRHGADVQPGWLIPILEPANGQSPITDYVEVDRTYHYANESIQSTNTEVPLRPSYKSALRIAPRPSVGVGLSCPGF